MDKAIERKIIEYRKANYGYKKIANLLNISKNTVATFCKRNNLATSDNVDLAYCKLCGMPFSIDKAHRNKVFCSISCRNKWWNKHRNEVYKDKLITKACLICHKKFTSYPSANRKYCSHSCYIKARYLKRGKANE